MTSKVSPCCFTLLTYKTKTTDYWNSHPFNPKTHGDYFLQVVGLEQLNRICLKKKKISIYLKSHFTSHCCTDENTSYETQSLFEKIQLKYDFYTHVTSNWQSQFSFSLSFVQSSHLGPLRTSRPLSQFGTDG